MQLCKEIYLLTALLPAGERFGLVSQMRRAAVSIPSNIAEGQARRTTGEYVAALSHAEGSAAELDTQLQLTVELGLLDLEQIQGVVASLLQVRKMLGALRRNLQASVS